MNVTYPTTATVNAVAIRCIVPIRYEDDLAELTGFPGLEERKPEGRHPTVTLVLDIDTRKVRDWPAGVARSIHTKPCDEGTYELLDVDGNVIAARVEYYVPGCVPGEDGDYFIANIAEDGSVTDEHGHEWCPSSEQIVEDFWPAARRRGSR